MNERTQSSREQSIGSGPWDNIFDDQEPVAGQVMVRSGPHTENLPLANMTVAEIRARFHDVLDIDEQSRAVLDGIDVGSDTVVRQGQVLMFTHRAGEKGLCAARPRASDRVVTRKRALAGDAEHSRRGFGSARPRAEHARAERFQTVRCDTHSGRTARARSAAPGAGALPVRPAPFDIRHSEFHAPTSYFPRWRPTLQNGFAPSPAPVPSHEP